MEREVFCRALSRALKVLRAREGPPWRRQEGLGACYEALQVLYDELCG